MNPVVRTDRSDAATVAVRRGFYRGLAIAVLLDVGADQIAKKNAEQMLDELDRREGIAW